MLARIIKQSAFGSITVLLFVHVGLSQSAPAAPNLSANDLVRAVVANELKAQDAGHTRWMYREDREENGKKTTKEVVQTSEGVLERTLAVEGRPLNVTQQQAEANRIESLVKNRARQLRLEQAKQKDAEKCRAFFKMIPDALIFSYAGREGNLVKLTYRPNPQFHPPSWEARVFHAMAGEMWVHESQKRLVSMSGQLVADVKFAGGLLGHLEKGGHFAVVQTELSPGQWDLSSMDINMKGKACLRRLRCSKRSTVAISVRFPPA
jgi:hypothetical protein